MMRATQKYKTTLSFSLSTPRHLQQLHLDFQSMPLLLSTTIGHHHCPHIFPHLLHLMVASKLAIATPQIFQNHLVPRVYLNLTLLSFEFWIFMFVKYDHNQVSWMKKTWI